MILVHSLLNDQILFVWTREQGLEHWLWVLPVSLCPTWADLDHDAFVGFARNSLPYGRVQPFHVSRYRDVQFRGLSLEVTWAWPGSNPPRRLLCCYLSVL